MKRLQDYNVYILGLPLLLIYFILISLFSTHALYGDEDRYIFYATNLTHGFYSPEGVDWDIVNGPGYPILLLPFFLLKIPLIFAKLLNGVFLYFANIFIFKALSIYLDRKKSLLITLVAAIVIMAYNRHMTILYTESFTIFLLSVFIFRLCVLYRNARVNFRELFFLASLLTLICLTKVIFGYVVLATFILLFIITGIRKAKINYRFLQVLFLSLVLSIPYLAYTYHHSKRLFYWGGSADTLYWMSTVHSEEYGDWVYLPERDPAIYLHHKAFIDSIGHLTNVEREKAYFAEAVKNIKNNPKKYLLNCFANVERLFFDFPHSYLHQKLNYLIFITCFILVFVAVSLFVFIRKLKEMPYEIISLFLFFGIYLGGSAMLGAELRQFYVIFPFFAVWCSYLFFTRLKIVLLNSTESKEISLNEELGL